jgi:hypothetical protein
VPISSYESSTFSWPTVTDGSSVSRMTRGWGAGLNRSASDWVMKPFTRSEAVSKSPAAASR